MSSAQRDETDGMGYHPEFDKLAKHFERRSRESQVETSKLAKELIAKKLALGDYHIPVELGAPVISVDGEVTGSNVNDWEHNGFLGYYVGMKQVNDQLIRVFFTTKNGFYYEGTRNIRQPKDYIAHPLAKEGFFIPTRDGYKVLDNGKLLLVSRIGLFSQIDGYQLSDQRLRKLIRERQRTYQYQQLYEENQIKLETLQERHDGVWMRLADATTRLRKLEALQTRLAKQKEVADGIAENLSAKAQYSQDVLENQRRLLKVEVSKYSKSIDDMLVLIERNQIDDGMRALRSDVPSLSAEFDRQMVEKWKHEGIINDDQQTFLLNRIGEMERRLQEQEERGFDETGRGHPSEGSLGNEASDIESQSVDSPTGLETGKAGLRGTKGDGKLSGIASKSKEKLVESYDSLKSLARGRQDSPDEESGSESEENDSESEESTE